MKIGLISLESINFKNTVLGYKGVDKDYLCGVNIFR